MQQLFKTESPLTGPRWLRVCAGIFVLILTPVITVAILLFSLCIGFLGFGNPDRLVVWSLFFLAALVPIAGTWLGAWLIRKPKSAGSMEEKQ
jgi:hypothetical protein